MNASLVEGREIETNAVELLTEGKVEKADKRKFKIFINEVKYKVAKTAMTETQLKALADIATENQLFLDAPGDHDDPQVFDDEPFKLKAGMEFYDVPVGNLGAK